MEGKRNSGVWGQRKVLRGVIAITLLAAALWVTPWLRAGMPAGRTGAGKDAPAASAAPSARTGLLSEAEPVRLPALSGTGDEARLHQQLEISVQDLAQREERVASLEAALRGDLLRGFWTRQALAAGLTLLVVVVGVGWMLKRGAGWSALRERMRADEARLQRLQLSVIQGLQQFESALAETRAGAGGAAAADAPATSRAERAPAPSPVEQAPVEWAPMEPPRRGRRIETIDEEQSWPALAPRFLTEDERAERSERAGQAEQAERAEGFERVQGHWTERLFAPEPGPRAAAPARSGLTAEPQRRAVPPARETATIPLARETATIPSPRAQIEYLAATGLEEAEIARRLRLSREEVRLALALESYEGSESRRGPGF